MRALSVADVEPVFRSALLDFVRPLPNAAGSSNVKLPSANCMFLPADDILVAIALLRHDRDFETMANECFMGVKTKEQVFHRIKNRLSMRSETNGNVVKIAKAYRCAPLTAAESARLMAAAVAAGPALREQEGAPGTRWLVVKACGQLTAPSENLWK